MIKNSKIEFVWEVYKGKKRVHIVLDDTPTLDLLNPATFIFDVIREETPTEPIHPSPSSEFEPGRTRAAPSWRDQREVAKARDTRDKVYSVP